MKRDAFTMVELLVVIGIIVLIIGFALPMVLRAYKAGDKTRTAADLNTIAVALDAYKNDFGEYPRVDVAGTGFAVLGKALVAPFGDTELPSGGPDTNDPPAFDAAKSYKPGDAVVSGVSGSGGIDRVALVPSTGGNLSDATQWAPMDVNDGFDGPGFRVRWDLASHTGGKGYGPYLQPEKFKMQGLAILDHNNNPILYYPQNRVKVNTNITTGTGAGYYVSCSVGTITTGTAPPTPMFDYRDNAFLTNSLTATPNHNATLAKMQVMLGVRNDRADVGNPHGLLTGGDTPLTTGPYILWSAGPDNLFGPVEEVIGADSTTLDRAIRKCDDVIHVQ